ncbi:MAG: hypothetical protein U0R52_07655 [Solirubrobacterales bacterium]
MESPDLKTPTVAGLLAYCDWLKAKSYQSDNAVEAWKTAIKKVFATVEPDDYMVISLDELDLDEFIGRFRTRAGAQYKAETISVYERRIRNALEAQAHYRDHGKPPSFRKPKRRSRADEKSRRSESPHPQEAASGESSGQLIRFPFPLRNGQIAELRLPPRLDSSDADRLSGFLRALQFEQQAQIPERTGEADAERDAA